MPYFIRRTHLDKQKRLVFDCNHKLFMDSSLNRHFSFLLRSMQTHPAVTKTKAKKFHNFVGKWCEQHVTDTMKTQCADWFMGRQSDLIPNITVKLQENDITKTPYQTYNRYEVQRLSKS